MRRWSGRAACGLLAVMVGTSATGCGLTLSSIDPPGSGAGAGSYQIRAVFADALGVPAHGLVKQDGLAVGEVSAVASSHWHAVLTLSLTKDTVLPANTTATIQQSSPLGEVFVSLDTPAHPVGQRLAPGTTIPLSRTTAPIAIEDVLALMGTVTNGAALDSLRTIVATIGQALNGHGADVRGVLEKSDAVLGDFIDQRRNLSALLSRTDAFTRQIAAERGQIAQAIENLTPVVKQLAGQTDDIVGLLTKLRTLSRTGTALARESGDNLVSTLRTAGPVLRELGSQSGRMRIMMQRLNTFAPLYDRASPGDETNISVDVFIKQLTGGGGSAGGGGITLPHPPPGTVPTLPPLGSVTGGLGGLLQGLFGKASTSR